MKKFFVTVTVLLALIFCLGAGLAGCGTPGGNGGGGKTLPDYDLMEDELSVTIAG